MYKNFVLIFRFDLELHPNFLTNSCSILFLPPLYFSRSWTKNWEPQNRLVGRFQQDQALFLLVLIVDNSHQTGTHLLTFDSSLAGTQSDEDCLAPPDRTGTAVGQSRYVIN